MFFPDDAYLQGAWCFAEFGAVVGQDSVQSVRDFRVRCRGVALILKLGVEGSCN